MNEKSMPLDFVEDDEKVARILFSPSMVEDGEIAPSAYNLEILKSGTRESYVSVDRITYRTPKKQYYNIVPRHVGDYMSGYAWTFAYEIRSASLGDIEIYLNPYPSRNNPFHAGISYNEKGKLIRGKNESPLFLAVTSKLAKLSRYVEF